MELDFRWYNAGRLVVYASRAEEMSMAMVSE